MTRQNDLSDRLTVISQLIAEALALADEGGESLLGSKLSDAQACADERLAALSSAGRQGCGNS